ncbi:LysR substrate-binding domain-containing protein [Enterovibrio coralii]|uniref:LysR substrate-binding domain-containing protein n=1 Tax=Enterovibrio coralii TaxID=294935 RepID=UPI000AE33290|nr:LysR substrate-binding domain-containing protein [Enterovibrio coralii]
MEKPQAQKKRLAHLNAIRAFEASARHLSFASAGQELNVSAAAVGQQVRQLEEWLGVKLFERAPSGASRLSLTDNAALALPDIQTGLNHLGMGLDIMRGVKDENVIVVSASPSISSKWLLPLLDAFHALHVDLDIHLETDVTLVDYAEKGIDIGIRYGLGNWPGLTSQHLMFEDVFPVCAPSYVESAGLSGELPNSLEGCTLLYDFSVPNNPAYPSWKEWCEKLRVTEPQHAHGLKINNFSGVMESAVRGNGIALGRGRLISEELDSGQLVAPFGKVQSRFRSQFCYYLVWPEGAVLSDSVLVFRDWLLAQTQ